MFCALPVVGTFIRNGLVTIFGPKDAAEALMFDVIKPVIVRDRLFGNRGV